MRNLFFGCLILSVSFMAIPQNKAIECIEPSVGFGPFLLNLGHYTTVVTGQISSVSDSGVNAILQIDQVLKGELHSDKLLLVRNSVQDIESYFEGRGVVRPCEVMAPPLPEGRRFMASLYRSGSGYFDGAIIPENDDGFFILEDSPKDQIARTYEESVAFLAEQLDVVPTSIQPGPNPRMVKIHLFTDTEEYVISADKTEPVKLPQSPECTVPLEIVPEACISHIIAPNGIDTVSVFPVGSGAEGYSGSYALINHTVEGNAAVFSPDSQLVTVWREGELRVFAVPNRLGLSTKGTYQLQLVRSLEVENLMMGAGSWSPNGRDFAFTNEAGVWLWDALTPDSHPTRLIPNDNGSALVRHFSPNGNYLALEHNGTRFHIDIRTLQQYPDGLFSDNDRLLAAYDTTTEPAALQIYAVLPSLEPLIEGVLPTITQFEWIGNEAFIFASCDDGQSGFRLRNVSYDSPCGVSRLQFGVGGSRNRGRQFDYDPHTNSLVALMDDNTITLNGEILDLSSIIDEPIRRVGISPLIDLRYQDL